MDQKPIDRSLDVNRRQSSSTLEGQHEHTLDGKGRVSVPSEFRSELGLVENDELIVTRHLKERCLLIFWPEAWGRFKDKISIAPPAIGSALRRVVCGTARRVKVDKLGRVQIPQVLRKYADLNGKCLVMGQGQLMELWSLNVWESTHGPDVYEDFDLSEFDL